MFSYNRMANIESFAVLITAALTQNINKDFILDLIWDHLAIYTMCVVALLHHKTAKNTVGSLTFSVAMACVQSSFHFYIKINN